LKLAKPLLRDYVHLSFAGDEIPLSLVKIESETAIGNSTPIRATMKVELGVLLAHRWRCSNGIERASLNRMSERWTRKIKFRHSAWSKTLLAEYFDYAVSSVARGVNIRARGILGRNSNMTVHIVKPSSSDPRRNHPLG